MMSLCKYNIEHIKYIIMNTLMMAQACMLSNSQVYMSTVIEFLIWTDTEAINAKRSFTSLMEMY